MRTLWYRHWFPSWFVAAAALATQPALCAGQLAVLVADARTGVPIADARIEIEEYNLMRRTDSTGELHLTNLPPGLVLVTASRLGYQPMEAAVVLARTDTSSVVFLMRGVSPVLDTVLVKADYWSPYTGEFEARRRTGLGRYLTVAQLDSAAGEAVPDLVARRFPGLLAAWNQSRTHVDLVSRHGSTSLAHPFCAANVYVDGQKRTGDDLASLMSQELIGVEYYSIAPPPQYPGGENACGSLLLWTRR